MYKQNAQLSVSETAGAEYASDYLVLLKNHRKKLNWLLGVVYLHAEKPTKMITVRMTHILCIEMQFCWAAHVCGGDF